MANGFPLPAFRSPLPAPPPPLIQDASMKLIQILVLVMIGNTAAHIALAQPEAKPQPPAAPPVPPAGADPFGPGAPRAPGTTPAAPTTPGVTAPPAVPAAKPPAPPVDPGVLRFHLVDGSVLIGKSATKSLDIETRFGKLTVPLEKIRWLRPGYEQQPARKARIAQLFDQLGDDDPVKRKPAATELIGMGTGLRPELERFFKDANTNRATEARVVYEKIAEQAGENDQGPFERQALSAMDAIVTTEFSMLGRVAHASLTIANEYGTFNLPIGQVKFIDRGGTVEQRAGSFTVNEQNIIGRQWASTKIHVDKGDKIILRASGQLQVPRFGTGAVSGPDGAANYGWYINGKIPTGALIVRVGASGEILKAGQSFTTIAKESGELQLGIGMNSRYLREGQPFPGEYKVDVTVTRD